jgi:sarcosine oxidase gamma subunit
LVGTVPALPPVVTDKEGHFSFPSVPPGRYTIRVQRDGFLVPGAAPTAVSIPYASDYAAYMEEYVARAASASAAIAVAVGPGQNVTGLTYYLVRGGTISGRVLDPLGRPSAVATVQALRLAYQGGFPTLLATKTASTNDRGEYRIFWLEPGDYYIRAEKTLPAGPARVYYPGTDDATNAVNVRVAEGMESPKIDLSLRNAVSVKISGTVTTIVAALNAVRPDAPKDEVERFLQTATVAAPQLYLSPIDTGVIHDGALAVLNTVTSAQDRLAGKFEIQNVRSGTYNLIAVMADRSSTPARYFMGKTLVEVGFQDVSGITVEVVPGRDLRGRIVYSGTTAPAAGSSVRVQLLPKAMLPTMALTSNLSATVEADGTFTIPNVPDFQYTVSVSPMPPDAYIADLRQGSFSVFDIGAIVLGRRGGDDFEVIVDSPGATINGKVAASNAKLAAGAVVALVPDERRQENPLLYKRTNASEAGVFSMRGVAPGRYKLFAWEDIPAGAEFNAEFRDVFHGEGTEITVAPGDTTGVQLRLISR